MNEDDRYHFNEPKQENSTDWFLIALIIRTFGFSVMFSAIMFNFSAWISIVGLCIAFAGIALSVKGVHKP